jgi:hypothetical protein
MADTQDSTTTRSALASLNGRALAHHRWAHETDRAAATAPARAGFLAKFERQVDPDGILDPDERARRAASARAAFYAKLCAAGVAARRAKAAGSAR